MKEGMETEAMVALEMAVIGVGRLTAEMVGSCKDVMALWIDSKTAEEAVTSTTAMEEETEDPPTMDLKIEAEIEGNRTTAKEKVEEMAEEMKEGECMMCQIKTIIGEEYDYTHIYVLTAIIKCYICFFQF